MEYRMQRIISAQHLADGLSTNSKEGQAILVNDDRISAVGPLPQLIKEAPPDTEHIDLGAATLAPGLIDGHTHLSLAGDGRSYAEMFSDSDELMVLTGAMNMRQHLRAGITTIREHGARNKVGFVLREGLTKGYIPGPRMQVSGRPITCTGGHFHMCNEEADGPDELRKSVRRRARSASSPPTDGSSLPRQRIDAARRRGRYRPDRARRVLRPGQRDALRRRLSGKDGRMRRLD
jgi:imidazolonepropionase-like amidohydrolase